jgi:hypothetical protein
MANPSGRGGSNQGPNFQFSAPTWQQNTPTLPPYYGQLPHQPQTAAGGPVRILDASVPTYPTAFADVRASSATYFNSSGVLSTAASNAQRIDYNRNTLALRGLEVEPAATNLVTTSDFTAWNQLAIFSVSSVTGLDGASSAYSIVPSNSSTSGHLIYLSASSYTTPNGQTSCLSVYAKSSDFSYIAVRENSGACAVFNVALGTVVGTNDQFPFTVSNATITAIGGGWYRLSAAFTASGAASTLISFIPCDGWTSGDPYSVVISPAADNVKAFTLFGPQAELGATSPSSVIVSAGSTTTRAADAYSFTLNASATQLTFTFDDLSTQNVTGLTGGSTYTIPTNLNRPWILYIDDNSGAAVTDNAALAATEAADVAAFAVSETINAALASTEAQDVALINASETDVAVLAATEVQDVAAIVAQVKDNAALAATEAQDVAAINASVGDNAALAATEAQDVAAFVAIETDTAVLAATEAPDTAAFSVQVKINAALGATEAPDLAAFSASTIDVAFLAATELPDTAAFSVSIISSTCFLSLAATEAPDIASVLAYTTALSLPTSRFIWPRAGDRYESLTVTTMKKAFSARNWDDFMSLANVRGIDVFGYNGLLSQAYEDAVPLINPTTSRQAVKFFLSNGQQFVIDVPDDMTGIYRDVLRRMSA